MHVLNFAFGPNIVNHIQVCFSVISCLKQRSALSSINIVTDSPAYYRFLQPYVTIHPIEKETLENWKGNYGYVFRAKIKAIQYIAETYKNEPILYLDGDTFIYKNLGELAKQLQQGKAVMHENEGQLSQMKDKSTNEIWRKMGGKKIQGLDVLTTDSMWNSGVVGSPNSANGAEFQTALDVCDEMCAMGIVAFTKEQLAFSLSLNKRYGIVQARDVVAHYWSNKKEWDPVITSWFAEQMLKQSSLDEMIDSLYTIDFSKTAVIRRERHTAEKLYRFANKWFSPRDLTFVQPDAALKIKGS